MARQPKDIEFRAIYEPDMDRMVRALRVLLEWNPEQEKDGETPPAAMSGARKWTS